MQNTESEHIDEQSVSSDTAPEPPSSSRIRFGIFGRLILVLAAITLIPLTVAGWQVLNTSASAMRKITQLLQLTVSDEITRTVEQNFDQARLELQAVAEILLGDGYGEDQQRIDLVSTRLVASETLDWITVYTPSGARLATLNTGGGAAPNTPGLFPAMFPETFQQALLQNSDENFVVGEVIPWEEATGVRVATRVAVNGVTRGFVMGGVSLAPLCQLLAVIEDRQSENQGSVLYIVDHTGRLVAHADMARAAAREDWSDRELVRNLQGEDAFRSALGYAENIGMESGKPALGSIQPVPKFAWAIGNEVPFEKAYLDKEAMEKAIVSIGIVSMVLVLVAAVLVAGFITHPVKSLAEATKRLAKRDFSARAVLNRSDELGELAHSFNRMAVELKDSEEALLQETRIRNDLSRYLAPEVVDEVVHHPERLKLGGERREVTVVFADIVAFTGMAERLEPEVIVSILNELFTFATEIIQRRGGIIDKFIGDCIMAVFGTPQTHEDDAERAILAAEDLLRWIEVGNRHWRKAYNIEIQMAVGINSGTVVAGNIGSAKRMEYTVIGDVVNVAARLEGLAKPGQILVSQTTRDAIGEGFDTEPMGVHNLSGRASATTVFTLRWG